MGAYILRRLLLVIPTLFGIMVINFALTQFVPGGPIEQIAGPAGGRGRRDAERLAGRRGCRGRSGRRQAAAIVGARGLPPEFLAELEVEFGFARIVCDAGYAGQPDSQQGRRLRQRKDPGVERFFIMMGNYPAL